MFTGYLAGHILFRSQFGGSPVLVGIQSICYFERILYVNPLILCPSFALQHAAGGISGMVVGMLVETMLFIIRASNVDGVKDKVKKASYRSRQKKDL